MVVTVMPTVVVPVVPMVTVRCRGGAYPLG